MFLAFSSSHIDKGQRGWRGIRRIQLAKLQQRNSTLFGKYTSANTPRSPRVNLYVDSAILLPFLLLIVSVVNELVSEPTIP